MAINASPMYQKAEEQFRSATSPQDKLVALEEMFRLVPKHKASEKLQSQIKQKIKTVREQIEKGAKVGKGGQQHDIYHVPKQGAGQVLLMGWPNVGKSAIVRALTSAKVEVAEFPHSTHHAVPGMAKHEDVPVQLVDMPPLTAGHVDPAMMEAFKNAGAVLLVVDLTAIELLDQLDGPIGMIRERGLEPMSLPEPPADESGLEPDPMRVLVAANKFDQPGAKDNLDGLKELYQTDLRIIPVSAETGEGLPEMLAELYKLLNVIRVYAKKPGKPADRESPFILPRGGTVHDMACLVHRELAEKLKTARAWGGGTHDGQQVHSTHVLNDKDVVELHF